MLGSALCGTSGSMTELIIYRGLQGIGGGIMMPMAMTIVGDIFPPDALLGMAVSLLAGGAKKAASEAEKRPVAKSALT